jgi:FtsZ-binding cell division protein ZapB
MTGTVSVAEHTHLQMELKVFMEQHDWLTQEVLNVNADNRMLEAENDLLNWYANFFDLSRTDDFLRPLLDKLVLAYKLRFPEDAPLIEKHFT